MTHDGVFRDGLKAGGALSAAFVTPRFARHHGGTAANISWHIAMLGGSPLLVASVGEDGSPYLALLRERGVDTSRVQQLKGSMTPCAIMATDSKEEQITFYHPGADALGTWPGEELEDDRDDIGYAIVAPRSMQVMLAAAEWCGAQKIPLLFDPGQWLLSLGADDVLRAVKASTGLIVNAYEWELLRAKLQCTVHDILKHVQYVVVTKSGDGVTIHSRDGEVSLPACKADTVVNPTGAGDAFRAGFLTRLVDGATLEEAAKLGAAVASKVVEQEGTLLDSIDEGELEERMRRAYGGIKG